MLTSFCSSRPRVVLRPHPLSRAWGPVLLRILNHFSRNCSRWTDGELSDSCDELPISQFCRSLGCAGGCDNGGFGCLDPRAGKGCGDGPHVVNSILAAGIPQCHSYYYRFEAAVMHRLNIPVGSGGMNVPISVAQLPSKRIQP